MLTCLIMGAGELFASQSLPTVDLIVAADGGLMHLQKLGIQPNVIIGDFDSLGFTPDGECVITLRRDKDESDMRAAIERAWQAGCREFHIYGGTGGRLDHTLANIQCLADLAQRGARGFLYGEQEMITCIHNDEMAFPMGREGTISAFAQGGNAENVTLSGLKYPLKNATLESAKPLGLSNEFTGEEATISVENGTLMIVWSETQ
ncbi:MAG: thiamine diphosphokinase [Oscillospiraceae bacterium]|nr:thiamine diphosphokinase [Oscillospiraceae bacterium]